MIAVDEIHVRVSRRAEEDSVARGASDEGVRGGIADAGIGFDLDDASGEKFAALAADQDFAEQVVGDEAGVAVVEGAGEDAKELRLCTAPYLAAFTSQFSEDIVTGSVQSLKYSHGSVL